MGPFYLTCAAKCTHQSRSIPGQVTRHRNQGWVAGAIFSMGIALPKINQSVETYDRFGGGGSELAAPAFSLLESLLIEVRRTPDAAQQNDISPDTNGMNAPTLGGTVVCQSGVA